MTPSAEQLAGDADFLLFDIQNGPTLRFAHVSAEAYADSAFLDARITPRPQAVYRAGLDDIEARVDRLRLPDLVIAHTSFCASTLLAQCLQSPKLLVLREPRVLSSIANEFRRHPRPPVELQRVFDCGWRLMGKRYRPDAPVAVKLSNFTNNLLEPIVALAPQTRMLLMWGALEDFLVSIIKHRDNARPLTTFLHAFLLDEAEPAARIQALLQLPPERQAAWVWGLQIRKFQRLADRHAGDLKTLRAADFLDRPGAAVAAIQRWCGIETGAGELHDRILKCMAQGSKGEAKSGAQIRAERAALRQTHAGAIRETLEWAASIGLPTGADVLDRWRITPAAPS